MTISEIAKESKEGRVYIIVHGKVYGVNGFSLLMYDDEPSCDLENAEERKVAKFQFTCVDEFYGNWYECSRCGDNQMFGNYCRNCGAKREADE